MRRKTGTAALAEHELGVLGAIARTHIGVAVGAERGAVLDSLKAMRADHGILFSKQFKQSRLEHNIATAPTGARHQFNIARARSYFFFLLGIETLIPWADLVTRERLAPVLFFFLGWAWATPSSARASASRAVRSSRRCAMSAATRLANARPSNPSNSPCRHRDPGGRAHRGQNQLRHDDDVA